MKKKLLVASLALGFALVALGGVVAVQLARLDADAVQRFVEGRLGEVLGTPVDVARRELHFLPPALHLHGLRSGGTADPPRRAGAALRLEVDEVRLGLSSLGLLAGRPVLRSVEVVRPRLVLPVDAQGAPQLPERGAGGERTAAADPDEAAPLVAVTRVRVRRGRVEAGPWRVEHVEGQGGLRFDLGLSLEVSGNAPGVGRLAEARVDLWDLGSPDVTWRARARLEDVALDAIGALAGGATAVRGHGALQLDAEGEARALTGGTLALQVPNAEVRGDGFALDGPVTLDAQLGHRWRLDLAEAELRIGDVLRKPAGAALALSARPDASLPPRAIRELRVESAPVSLRGELVAERAQPGVVRLTHGRVDLAALGAWWHGAWRPRAGAIVVDRAALGGDGPWQLDGALESAELAVPVPEALEERAVAPALAIDGPFALDGRRLESAGLVFSMGGQRAVLGGHVDLASRRFDASLEAEDLDVGAILAAFAGEAVLEGRLSAQGRVSGGPALASLEGAGRFDLVKGRIPGADFPWPVEVRDPRLATGEEGREFDRLSGRFVLLDGVAQLDGLAFTHPYLSAWLHGDVQLAGGALELTGELEISEELDVGLGGPGRRRILPVRRVHGTLADPQFEMDREAMVETFGRYADNLRAAGR